MNVNTNRCLPEVSQTALALLALLAAGKSVDPATIRSLLENQCDSEDHVHLTVFSDNNSDHDEEDWGMEPPVILPFHRRKYENYSNSNGYGALPLRETSVSHLRIFSPDTADYDTGEGSLYAMSAVNAPLLKVYEG